MSYTVYIIIHYFRKETMGTDNSNTPEIANGNNITVASEKSMTNKESMPVMLLCLII